MKCSYACGSSEHTLARRGFLGGMLGAGTGIVAGGLGALSRPATAAQLASDQKRIVVFNMHGGLSQLESWDPKPKTDTGGPFRAIPTSVEGIHISELLPLTAQQMHHLCLVRGVNTAENDHGKGAYMMTTGRRQSPALDFPKIGAVAARALAPRRQPAAGTCRGDARRWRRTRERLGLPGTAVRQRVAGQRQPATEYAAPGEYYRGDGHGPTGLPTACE